MAARVRPEEHHPQTADDGSGSFCLPYTFSLCFGIPKRYRQIRRTGCNPNLHLFTQGWASKCFKSNSTTAVAKPPESPGCNTGFRCGWEGSVLCCLAVPPPHTRILIPTIPITFDSAVPPSDRHWSWWRFPRHPIYPQPSQFCLSPDTKHSLKPFGYHSNPSPENLSLATPKYAVPSATSLSTEQHHRPLFSSMTLRHLSDGPALWSTHPTCQVKETQSRSRGCRYLHHPSLIMRDVSLQPFVRTSGKEQRRATAYLHARCSVATAWPPVFHALQRHLSFFQVHARAGSAGEQTASFRAPHVPTAFGILQISP